VSLYLTYRPKNLDNLVGQDHIKQTLEHAIKNNALSHAYLFSGPRGTGKTSTARLVAKAITCRTEEMELLADKGEFIDIIEIDAASNRGIDEIRDLREKIQFLPVQSSKKVYIIDEVHMLTKEAFNALLKTLEEPPEHVCFILATTEIHKVPDTIVSRCQYFGFQRISENDIIKRLEYICQQESLEYEGEALQIIAHQSEGGMRDAISLLEQLISDKGIRKDQVQQYCSPSQTHIIKEFTEALIENQTQKTLEYIEKIVYDGVDIQQFLKELLEYLREVLLKNISDTQKTKKVIYIIEGIQKAAINVKNSFIPQLPLEVACIKLGFSPEEHEDKGGFLNAIGFAKSKKEKTEKIEEKSKAPVVKDVPVKKGSADVVENKVSHIESKADEFSLENIKQKWNIILEEVTTPTVKAALKSSILESISDDKNLHISVTTDFYYDLLQSAKGTREVLAILTRIYGKKIEIQVQNKSLIDLKPEIQKNVEEKEEKKEKKVSIVDMANEIFKNN
jgi:DNA polymerase III subunit gamma/tau